MNRQAAGHVLATDTLPLPAAVDLLLGHWFALPRVDLGNVPLRWRPHHGRDTSSAMLLTS